MAPSKSPKLKHSNESSLTNMIYISNTGIDSVFKSSIYGFGLIVEQVDFLSGLLQV